MFLRSIPAHENWNKRNEHRTEPGSDYHAHSGVGVHEVVIVEGFDDGVEPVKGDSTKVESANCACMDIDRVPEVAYSGSKNPPEKK